MKPTFDHTVNVLVQAYLNDELEHGVCSACAVGNIIAASIGTKPGKAEDSKCMVHSNEHFENGTPVLWNKLFTTGQCGDQRFELEFLSEPDVIGQLEITGYTAYELARIEQAFESAPGRPKPEVSAWFKGKSINPVWMFNGLMAVVDVLAEIHNVDLSVRESAKLQFVKP